MRTSVNLKTIVFSLLMVFAAQVITAQTYKLDNSASALKIDGTSNLHDWTIEAKEQQGKIVAEINNGQLVDITQLDFIVNAESLKSGKSGMDKNTYKALNTGKYKQITYKLNDVKSIDCVTTGNCKVTTTGTLTIAGNAKQVEIIFDAKVSNEKIIISGSTPLVMSQYKIDPPTAMFGTITTGDKVVIKFNSVFNK